MKKPNITLTDAEWVVMECLWEQSPRTGRETVQWLEERMGWTRSTSLTLLRRLEGKGAVTGDKQGELKQFRPIVSRESAVLRETENLLERAYHGSLSLLLTSFTKKQVLSNDEIKELYAILKEMEEKNDC